MRATPNPGRFDLGQTLTSTRSIIDGAHGSSAVQAALYVSSHGQANLTVMGDWSGAPPVKLMARALREIMDVRRLLSSMALEVQSLTPVEASDRIAHYARIAVDADESGIMLVKSGGKIHSAAGTSDNVEKAHMLQAQFDEGPCLEAICGGNSTYLTGDAANDPRWPTWGPRMAELGYRSVVSVRLETHDRQYGSLNAYSADLDDFSTSDVEVMEYLGAHASAAIAASQTVDGLNHALESRVLIGQAQGILMTVYDLDSEGAFQYMRRLSMDSNTPLRDVANHVVAQRHELRKHLD